MIDPRLTPARGDVAAAKLQGHVEAARFVEASPRQVKNGVSALRETPSFSGRLETQLLHGEIFDVYDEDERWAWGQCALDGYVGYVLREDLDENVIAPTHRVAAIRAIGFPFPDKKSQPHLFLSANAKVSVAGIDDGFAQLARGSYVFADQLEALAVRVDDWVSSAEHLVGVPYLWGGRDTLAVDCSGLVQSALQTGGILALRDADMQERSVGVELPGNAKLRRGDLVFWDGHVGIMRSATELLHANAFHMRTVIEPLTETIARMGAPRTLRRP